MTKERHIFIENVNPVVACGRYPAKRTVGEECLVEATIFRDSADIIRAELCWQGDSDTHKQTIPMTLVNRGLDFWQGNFKVTDIGCFTFTIEAWTDIYATWVRELDRKVNAGRVDLASELAEGLMLIEKIHAGAKGNDRAILDGALATLQPGSDANTALAMVSRHDVEQVAEKLQPREDAVVSDEYRLYVERKRALFGSWYELFPRSQTDAADRSGTFKEAEKRLDYVRDLGFDVIYLPPIHPIGHTARKGKNNSLVAEPGDVGSPWAIGNENGGHDAIEPSLGTLNDFKSYVKTANKMGIEIALDFAINCSPDHPWVKQHPDWFYHRPDGTIKYSENPPKKYEDIYPINFDTSDKEGLWEALKNVLLHWVECGVTIFRVDNPHTKPFVFWEWVIKEIHKKNPDVIFLAEAFSRPPIMKLLAKIGFSQSYSYFTWRNSKDELQEYLTELTQTDMAEYYRPNFFTNTQDILTEYLQHGGPSAFKIRLLLAATLSPTYGIYSGFEFFENVAVAPGKEEYLNSEKYEIKVRDLTQPSMHDLIARVNQIRRENPALQVLRNVQFFESDNDQIIFYGKMTPDRSNILLIAVSLDPFQAQASTVRVPLDKLGIPWGSRYNVRDLLTGEVYNWGEHNYVYLNPMGTPAHILKVERL
ncbi:MAG: maltotransferase domain-containing protein [Chloroflexota bacterium]